MAKMGFRAAVRYRVAKVTTLISVLLPYRDAEATIDEALGSILAQRDVELEVVAVDDGSRDGGPARVDAARRKDARVKPIATGGVGIARALDVALAHASGSLVARMDADDVALPTRLAASRALLESDPRLAVVGTRVVAFPDDAAGEGLRRYIDWQNAIVDADAHARDLFIESPLCHPSVLVRRRALDEVGGYRAFDGPEDYDLWLRFDAAGFRMAKVPEVLLRWRHQAGRMTFADPRFSRERFLATKAPHLARRLRAIGRPIAVWGAGQTGRRVARALEPHGICASRFIDIDPAKIGRIARGVAIVSPGAIVVGAETIVVAVGARGARDLVRADLVARGAEEGRDFVCAS